METKQPSTEYVKGETNKEKLKLLFLSENENTTSPNLCDTI